RHFGGLLDDPAIRLQHYLEVLETELSVPSTKISPPPQGVGHPPAAGDVSCFRSSSDSCSTFRS
ncbi:MAG: hypothetical protein AAB363_01950, partial [Planctomycetota bacterium]